MLASPPGKTELSEDLKSLSPTEHKPAIAALNARIKIRSFTRKDA
jgi:hypothetical protein